MLQEFKIDLGPAPALLVWRKDLSHPLPAVLFYHGLGVSKEIQMKELSSLAEEGFLAVGIDNVGHGDRRYKDFESRLSFINLDFEKEFINAVYSTMEEIPLVVDALLKRGFAHPEKLGVAGISMGGYIAYGAPLFEPRIRACTPILGSPYWRIKELACPARFPEKFFPLALLSQTAGADENVPPRHARQFQEKLLPFYQSSPERLKYIEFEGAHHFMPEGDWNVLWKNVLLWFHKFL